MYKLRTVFLLFSIAFCSKSFAENVWTGGVNEGEAGHVISVIDSGEVSNTVLVTLESFSHERYSALSNRIILKSSSAEHSTKLLSFALSAFHSGAKVSFFINENCEAERVILLK